MPRLAAHRSPVFVGTTGCLKDRAFGELGRTRAKEHPRRYTHIRVRHIVSGEGAMQENLEKAVNLSHEKYCSVAASLNAEIEVEAALDGALTVSTAQ